MPVQFCKATSTPAVLTPLFPSLMQEVVVCHCLHSFIFAYKHTCSFEPHFSFIDAGGGCMPLPA